MSWEGKPRVSLLCVSACVQACQCVHLWGVVGTAVPASVLVGCVSVCACVRPSVCVKTPSSGDSGNPEVLPPVCLQCLLPRPVPWSGARGPAPP